MDRASRKGAVLTLLGVLALGALVLLVPPLRDAVTNVITGDAEELGGELRDLGAAGALVLAGLMLVHAVVPFPSELVNAAAGFVYGFWIAFPLVLAGWRCPRSPLTRWPRRRAARCASGSRGRSAWRRARG